MSRAGSVSRSPVTGLLLAGGSGRRFGGVDKGLLDLHGRPLAAWILDALRPQVGTVLISANRNLDAYRALGCAVIEDRPAGFAGPLAGIISGLAVSRSPYLLTLPCDAPRVPMDLAARMLAACERENAAVAVAHDGRGPQWVHLLISAALGPRLDAAFGDGVRAVGDWVTAVPHTFVDFSDRQACFGNLNTPQDLDALREAPPAALTGPC